MVNKLLPFKQQLVLLIVTGLLLFSGLDKIEVNIMEARNFISAREMVHNKEYLLTTLNNEPRYQKPPLPTWLTAISGSLFGFDSLFGLRLPVVAITFLLVFAFYYFSRLIGLSSTHSLNNALILITSFYIFFAGRDNQWDMYTHSFMLISIYFLWRILQEDSHVLSNSFISGIFLGFSFLSKGPVSFYALLLPFLISYSIVYHIPVKKKIFYLFNTMIMGLAVGLSWYIYVRLKDPEYFRVIATHELSNWGSYEVKPFWYYWNFFIQSGLWTIPSLTALFYPYLKSRVHNLKAYRFAVLWTLLSVIFLSLIPEKKVRYLVPALIPLALTTGFYIEYLIKSFNKNMSKKENIWVCFSFGIIAFIGFAYPFVLIFLLKKTIKEYMILCVFSSILMYICAFAIVKGLMIKDFNKIFYSMILLFVVVGISLISLTEKFFYNSDSSPASKAQIFEKQFNVHTYRLSDISPEIIWDFGKPVPLLKSNVDQNGTPYEKQFALMANVNDSLILKNKFPCYKIDKKYTIILCSKGKKRDRLTQDYYVLTYKDK